jgi:hypothetical protein
VIAKALPSFSQMPVERRIELFKKMSYELHPMGTKLTYSGAEAVSVYFFITGTADIEIEMYGKPVSVKSLSDGDCYGAVDSENLFKAGRIIRDQSVTCTTNCDLIRIDLGMMDLFT